MIDCPVHKAVISKRCSITEFKEVDAGMDSKISLCVQDTKCIHTSISMGLLNVDLYTSAASGEHICTGAAFAREDGWGSLDWGDRIGGDF